jgi:group I intron endonuclease
MDVIYKITNIVNGKFYIGKTKNIKKRWKGHLSMVGKKRHPLYDSILYYGKDNFIIEIVDKADSLLIDDLEKEWIKKTNAIELGYNITEGGTGGDTFTNLTEEQKEIRRKNYSIASKISNQKNIGLHRQNTKKLWENDEYRYKVTNKLKERYKNQEFKQQRIEIMKKTLSNPDMLKIWSECKKGSKNGRWLGYVVVTDLDGNEKKYESAVEAAKTLKVAPQRLREHCINNTTYKVGIYKDWKFRYQKD